MRKLFYYLLLNLCFLPSLYAQHEILGSYEFGRIFGLIYDQNTENKLYALSMGNHILSSNDNGQNWNILHSLPNGNFNSVDNNLRSFGSNHLSFHLMSRGDLGRTINVLNLTSNEIDKQYTAPNPSIGVLSWVNAYSLYPNDDNYALISIRYDLGLGLVAENTYYTSDGGNSWILVYDSTMNHNITPLNVAIHPTNPQKLYISMGMGSTETIGGFWVSENGGMNWSQDLDGLVLKSISFHPEDPNEMWLGTGISFGASPEKLLKSTDGGSTWDEVNINWTNYLLDCINIIKFNPSNPDNILILEDNEVAITHDGGSTWEMIVYPDAYDNPEEYSYGLDASFNPFNENEVFISANYYPMFSTDKGQSMERIKTPFSNSIGVQYISNESEEHLYYGVQFGLAHKNLNTEEEVAFEILPLNLVSGNTEFTIISDPKNLGRIFTLTGGFMGSNLNVSEEHGENPHQLFSTFNRELWDVQTLPNEPTKIWACLSNLGEEIEFVEIDFSNLENVQSTSIPFPNSPGPVTGILFPENNSNIAFVSKGSRVHKTENAGQTWTMMSEGLEILNSNNDLIFTISQNPLNASQFSISSTKGIFTSLDGGETWTQKLPGYFHKMEHSTVSENDWVAITHDTVNSEFSVRISTNAGESWQTIDQEFLLNLITNTPMNYTSASDFHFYDHYLDMFISSLGLGVVKITLDLETLTIIDSEIHNENSVILYPNPTKDSFAVLTEKSIQTIEIYSMTGQKLVSKNKNSKSLDVSHLSAGIYIVKIHFENGEIHSEKLVRK